MSNKVYVDVNYLESVFSRLKEINSLNFSDIVWLKDGEVLEVGQELLQDWKLMGLNNTSFISEGMYEE